MTPHPGPSGPRWSQDESGRYGYANAVLADRETSITRLVRSLRLARCQAALSDPLQRHRTISEIAYGWGFSDMTNFSRVFKAAFGMAPRGMAASYDAEVD